VEGKRENLGRATPGDEVLMMLVMRGHVVMVCEAEDLYDAGFVG